LPIYYSLLMYRKIFLLLFPIILASALCTILIGDNATARRAGSFSLSGVLWTVSLLWIVVTTFIYGKTIKTKWALVISFVLCLALIALPVIKIRRIVDLSLFFTVLPMVTCLLYLAHFIAKKKKQWFADIVKFVFVCSTMLVYIATFLGTQYEEEIMASWALSILLLAVAIYRQVYLFRPQVNHVDIAEQGNYIFIYTDAE